MCKQELLHEISEKYSEWIEMAADKNAALVDILINLLIQEKTKNIYNSRRLNVR